MIMSAAARQSVGKNRIRGLIFSIVAGCIMGLFYPQLMHAIGPDKLTPYVALVFFAAGVLLNHFFLNTPFFKTPCPTYSGYFPPPPRPTFPSNLPPPIPI